MSEALTEFLKYAAKEREQFYAVATLNPVKKPLTYHLVVEPSDQSRGMRNDPPFNINMFGQTSGSSPSEQQAWYEVRQAFRKMQYAPHTIVLFENYSGNLVCSVGGNRSIDLVPPNTVFKNQLRQKIQTNTPLSSEQFAAVRAYLKNNWGYDLRDNNLVEQLKLFLEKQPPLGQPILPTDRVTCLDAYGSSHDFWNDVKSAVLKPLLILALGFTHIVMMLYFFGKCLYSVLSRQQGAVENFSLALRSFLLATVYIWLTLTSLVLISQVLSMSLRVLMTIPGLFAAIPATIKACEEDGMMTVAGRGLQGFGSGFCGMFFSNPASQEASLTQLSKSTDLREHRVQYYTLQG